MAAVRARAAATKRKTIILPRVKDFFIRKPSLASTIYPNTKNDRRNLYSSRSSKRPRALAENDYRSNNLSPISGGIAQLVERLVRNNALTNALTFSYALSHALSKVNPRLVCCFTLSQMCSKTAAGVQRCCERNYAVLSDNLD